MLHEGQLVQIIAKDKYCTEDGFTTLPVAGLDPSSDIYALYEEITIHSYPSWNDFHGVATHVRDNDIATVMKYIGRPTQISSKDQWDKYDIYEVLISGNICQVFRFNLSPINLQLVDFL